MVKPYALLYLSFTNFHILINSNLSVGSKELEIWSILTGSLVISCNNFLNSINTLFSAFSNCCSGIISSAFCLNLSRYSSSVSFTAFSVLNAPEFNKLSCALYCEIASLFLAFLERTKALCSLTTSLSCSFSISYFVSTSLATLFMRILIFPNLPSTCLISSLICGTAILPARFNLNVNSSNNLSASSLSTCKFRYSSNSRSLAKSSRLNSCPTSSLLIILL